VAPAGKLGHEADEGELALASHAKVELEQPDLADVVIDDWEHGDVRVMDDGRELRILKEQPREP